MIIFKIINNIPKRLNARVYKWQVQISQYNLELKNISIRFRQKGDLPIIVLIRGINPSGILSNALMPLGGYQGSGYSCWFCHFAHFPALKVSAVFSEHVSHL